MLKLWGSLLLIVAGALAGCRVGEMYTSRLKLHKKLVSLYNETAILLEYSFLTFGEIVSRLKESGEYSEFGFLNVSSECLDIRQAVLDGIDSWDACIEDSSRSNLVSFFTKLGTTDIQGQISYARLAAAHEQEIISSVEKKYQQKTSLSRTFGALGGAFAAIMMI